MSEQMNLVCSTGEIVAKIGDRFKDHSGEWEIVSFGGGFSYSPSSLGGTPNVVLRPMGPMPSWLAKYANADGTIDFCGDSVAASLLDQQDGKRRDARGGLLTEAAGKGTE